MRYGMVFGLVISLFPAALDAQEWTRFRGPNGSGVSSTTVLPIQWTEKDYTWTTRLPGRGHSSPVVWGERIFTTAAENSGQRLVLGVDAKSGKILWQREMGGALYKMHKRNSVATSTPAVDGKRVYVLWATPAQFVAGAFDHEGKPLWQAELGAFKSQHGIGVSPIVVDDVLIVPNDQDGASSLLALDAASGARRWEIPRKTSNATYATPCILERPNLPPEVIFTNWKHGMTAVEPRTGKIKWELSIFEPEKAERAIVSPILAGDLILGTCGFVTAQRHFVAVRPGPDGVAKEAWRIEKNVAHLPTPLVKLPWVFSLTEKGVLTCLDARTGAQVWQDRLDNNFSASPVLAGENLYCVADDGEVVVVHAGPAFKVASRQSLGEATQSTPAIASGQIVFRTLTQLRALPGKTRSLGNKQP